MKKLKLLMMLCMCFGMTMVQNVPVYAEESVPYSEENEQMVSYTINYLWNTTDYKVKSSDVEEGFVGQQITVDKKIDGYTQASIPTVTLENGTNEINVYYYKNESISPVMYTDVVYDGKPHELECGFSQNIDADFSDIKLASLMCTDVGTYSIPLSQIAIGVVDKTQRYIITKASDVQLTIVQALIKVNDPKVVSDKETDKKWIPKVTYGDDELVPNNGYKVEYFDGDGKEITDFKNQTGNVTARITGVGNFKGVEERHYYIMSSATKVTQNPTQIKNDSANAKSNTDKNIAKKESITLNNNSNAVNSKQYYIYKGVNTGVVQNDGVFFALIFASLIGIVTLYKKKKI